MSKDLIVIREYMHKGISVPVEINFMESKASLVEKNPSYGQKPFQHKKWLFVEREVDYMQTWVVILEAMQHAVKEAMKELEASNDKKMIDLALMVSDIKDEVKADRKRKKQS